MRYVWKDKRLQKEAESIKCLAESLEDACLDTPYQFFSYFFDNNVLQQIASQPALYSTQQKPNKPSRITAADIQRFIGVSMSMSLIRLSYTRNYWSNEFRVSQIADFMTLNRLEEIKRFIHFSDNLNYSDDKFYQSALLDQTESHNVV